MKYVVCQTSYIPVKSGGRHDCYQFPTGFNIIQSLFYKQNREIVLIRGIDDTLFGFNFFTPLYISLPESAMLLPNIRFVLPSPCKNILEQAKANKVGPISNPTNLCSFIFFIVSGLFCAKAIMVSIDFIRNPPLPVQVSKTTSSKFNRAKSTIKLLIWSGVSIISNLSYLFYVSTCFPVVSNFAHTFNKSP